MPEPVAKVRARHALKTIEDFVPTDGRKQVIGNYVSYVKGLPANILSNGLGQAMAMEAMGASKDTGHRLLCRHMNIWLLGERGSDLFPRVPDAGTPPPENQPARLVAMLTHAGATQDDYVRAQAEALAYLDWLKKFAVALLSEAAK